MPGNLFQGPRERSDDPGEKFELYSKTILGEERYGELLSLYNNITNFIECYEKVDQLDAVGWQEENELQKCITLAFEHTVVPYDSRHW